MPRVLDPNFWPQHVLVRKWIFNPRIAIEPTKSEKQAAVEVAGSENAVKTITNKNGNQQ